MVVVIFVISFLHGGADVISVSLSSLKFHRAGPSVWDASILSVTKLDQTSLIARFIPNIKLNEASMVLAAIGLAFNILVR
jgi:hypothetical protein